MIPLVDRRKSSHRGLADGPQSYEKQPDGRIIDDDRGVIADRLDSPLRWRAMRQIDRRCTPADGAGDGPRWIVSAKTPDDDGGLSAKRTLPTQPDAPGLCAWSNPRWRSSAAHRY